MKEQRTYDNGTMVMRDAYARGVSDQYVSDIASRVAKSQNNNFLASKCFRSTCH